MPTQNIDTTLQIQKSSFVPLKGVVFLTPGLPF
jgi:hypothetical protein